MSIKIYDGYKAISSDVFEVAQQIRNAIEPMFHQRFAAAFETATEKVGENWDKAFIALLPSPHVEAWQKPIPAERWKRADDLYDLIATLQRTSSHTFSDLDFGYDVILLPNRDTSSNNKSEPLVLLYSGARSAYQLALEGEQVATPYGYWDSTDRPDGVSAAAWKRRKAAWQSILDSEDKTPSEAGLLINKPIKSVTTWKAAK